MKCDCYIYKDIAILYLDYEISDESRKNIENHLSECKECKKYYDNISNEKVDMKEQEIALDTANIIKIAKKMRVRKFRIIIISSIICILFAMILTDFIRAKMSEAPLFAFKTKDIEINAEDASIEGYTEYIGLGYRFIQYHSTYSRNDCEILPLMFENKNEDMVNQLEIDAIESYLASDSKNNIYEKTFSTIKVFGCKNINDTTKKVFIWNYYESYFLPQQKENQSLVIDSLASLPCIIIIENKNGEPNVISVEYPGDGNAWKSSIKNEYPFFISKQIFSFVSSNEENLLKLKSKEKAEEYLEEK